MWPMSFPYPERRPLDVAGRTYDYVIVGGGTAGCVLASRLSEDLSVSVLVLEKGYVRDHALSRIPTLSQDFSRNDLQVVKFKAEPVSEMPTDGGRQNVKEGIVLYGCDGLGGASRINGMMLTRGWVGEYQAWADDLGLDEWGWKDVEPSGIPLRPFTKHFAFYSYMERAMASLNLVKNEDINTSTTTAQGYYHTHTAVDVSGQRHTAYHGYLNKQIALARQDRLSICTGAAVTKVCIDTEPDGRLSTRGVFFKAVDGSTGSLEVYVKARREIILCAGALRSPQILMLSGIGPKDQLERHNIPVLRDNPHVGSHLTDHVAGPAVVISGPEHESLLTALQSPFRLLYHLFLYIWYGLGLIASPTTALVMFLQSYTLNDKTMEARRTHPDSTLSTLDASKKSNIPDFEVQITPLPCFQPTFERVTALKDTDTGKDVPAFTLWPVLMSPFSRGRVELVDADMATPPRIIHPFFTDIRNHDISVMKKALRFCMRLSEAFMKSEGQVGDDKYPYLDRCSIFMGPGMDDGMGEYEASGTGRKTVKSRTAADVTDIELETFIYRWFGTGYHQAAERPFEKRINGRTGGVVDQHLRVFGVSGLRVADASIFPVIPSTHPMIPTMMVAERCARFLKSYE
ncbi:choline dehydrogenase [Purpureocillium lilacinum]|uniref:Choline dehydrogenase n=1 Tax=Purpureocillium lilacinum TaxID=33203 RepID=A0A179FWG6_PURLI|nr:choline dehydrogenase [Purpureocillium lilacinum]OAQ69578.1 choline dehydrogenase [Purpureocillium lilacinum]